MLYAFIYALCLYLCYYAIMLLCYYALCFMLYALCFMLYALCFMLYALCSMLYAYAYAYAYAFPSFYFHPLIFSISIIDFLITFYPTHTYSFRITFLCAL